MPAAQSWFDKNGDLLEKASADTSNEVLLFDLEKDVRERTNLAAKLPEVVQQGLDLIQSYVTGGEYMEPQDALVLHPESLPLLHGGVWSPFQSENVWNREFAKQQARNHMVGNSPSTDMASTS
ncbi:hypothetical protein BASA81_004126 [Batrachochytrium salamandrivorans]|nr:hypothetical protein BASA81_004126 [Batrachochytrium salamandrivorans]